MEPLPAAILPTLPLMGDVKNVKMAGTRHDEQYGEANKTAAGQVRTDRFRFFYGLESCFVNTVSCDH